MNVQYSLFSDVEPVKDVDKDEYYTPIVVVDAARAVMGAIDVDPASCDEANLIVEARKYYTKERSALLDEHLWAGNVWMNPPYSRGLVDRFAYKFLDLFSRRFIQEGIILVNNTTENQWCQDLQDACTAICLPKGRLLFWGPNESQGKGKRGSLILYFVQAQFKRSGRARFARHFEAIGPVYYPHHHFRSEEKAGSVKAQK